MSEEILPCAHCGGEGRAFAFNDTTVMVCCEDCDNQGPVMIYWDLAIEKWNDQQSNHGIV